jgi:hypothetical protein
MGYIPAIFLSRFFKSLPAFCKKNEKHPSIILIQEKRAGWTAKIRKNVKNICFKQDIDKKTMSLHPFSFPIF